MRSEASRSYPGRPAQPGRGQASLQPVGLARNPGTDRCKPLWAVRESAEVVVLISRHQREQEGPNDEVQGGAIGSLATRELLAASRSVIGRRRRQPDSKFTAPTRHRGSIRRGASRAASLGNVRKHSPAHPPPHSSGWPWSTLPLLRLVSKLFVEPPDAVPHVRWCGGRRQQWRRLPDCSYRFRAPLEVSV